MRQILLTPGAIRNRADLHEKTAMPVKKGKRET
jgi:hypothetical protein